MKKPVYLFRVCFVVVGAVSVLTSCLGKERDSEHLLEEKFDADAGLFVLDSKKAGGASAVKYQTELSNNNHAVYFNKKKIDELFNRAGADKCIGFRIYRTYNVDPELVVRPGSEIKVPVGAIGMIMVGVDMEGNDLVDQSDTNSSAVSRVLVSYEKCPDNCDNLKSVLDSHPTKVPD